MCGVRAESGEERSGAWIAEAGEERVEAESQHRDGERGRTGRRGDVVAKPRPSFGERRHHAPPCVAIAAELGGSAVDRVFKNDGAAVVERMRQWRGRVHPFEAVSREPEFFEARRSDAHRVDGGADVVEEARQCELLRAGASTDGRGAFVYRDGVARAGEYDGGAESVGSAADDGGVHGVRTHTPNFPNFWGASVAQSRHTIAQGLVAVESMYREDGFFTPVCSKYEPRNSTIRGYSS